MKWSILTDRLPTEVEIGGETYSLDTRTSTALNCLRKLREDLPDELKHLYVTRRLGLPPEGGKEAVEYLMGANPKGGKGEPSYDYFQDANVIYGAFQQAYGLGLDEVTSMHWWAFLALLESIPKGTRFIDIINIRTMKVEGDREQKMAIMKAKAAVALKGNKGGW